MAAGLLPNFKSFYDGSQVFTTEADEVAPNLEPWIQWYSAHTGLSFRQHRVFNLTDGPKAPYDDLWRILRREGIRVANCSSMNCREFSFPESFFLPDPWCTTEKAFPAPLNGFHRFIASHVQEYSNASKRSAPAEYLGFAAFLLRHGLRAKTVLAAASLFAREIVSRGKTAWKRAPLLDKLQFDVFRHYQRKFDFEFATFFSNSTAHYQHAYWRYMEPELFTPSPPEKIRQHQAAVLYGYQEMDKLLGDFLAMEAEVVTLVLASALSQQPYLRFEKTGGKHFYRPKNIEALLGLLHIRYDRVLPVMTHQYILHLDSKESREAAERALRSVKIGQEEVFSLRSVGDHELYFGNRIGSLVENNTCLTLTDADIVQNLPFYEIFYQIPDTKSGYHHPDGVLWIKTGSHQRHEQKVSILDVFPTVLDFFGVETQENGPHKLLGETLWPFTSRTGPVLPLPSDEIKSLAKAL